MKKDVIASEQGERGNLREFQLIEQIKKWLNQNKLTIPIGDDAAAFQLKPNLLTLFSSDSLVEDVHFKLDSISPVDLGFKSLVVNISDIAAMGGLPMYATVSLGLPAKIDLTFLKKFYQGLSEAAKLYSVTIAGGDLTSSKQLMISIALIGQAAKNRILTRNSAKVGDKILVTGRLGAAAAAGYNLRPQAKVKQGAEAARLGAKTAIDISDGLVSDCARICEASSVGCRIFAGNVPVDSNAALENALSGGEDYELIFTAAENASNKLLASFRSKKWSLTMIGEITSEREIEVMDKNGKLINWHKGYEHFG